MYLGVISLTINFVFLKVTEYFYKGGNKLLLGTKIALKYNHGGIKLKLITGLQTYFSHL